MSAIWGVIDFNKKKVTSEEECLMKAPYSSYRIDCFRSIRKGEVLFGYGGQYFTKESLKEELPIVDSIKKGIFVADVVLDNREELFGKIEKCEDTSIPDGKLMYEMWNQWGKDSLQYFRGTYSFAYYNSIKDEIVLATDCLGSRCLYYMVNEGRVIFSTLMKPILNIMNKSLELNYRWITDYLALDNLALYTEYEETHIKGIYKVGPGEIVRISKDKVVKEAYWNPIDKLNVEKDITDERAKAEFIETFKSSVSETLRADGKTGILLSGGLDSTSVACFAAPELEKRKEDLYSYTSIPITEYHSDILPEVTTNEKIVVEITEKKLKNLKSSYIQIPDENAWDGSVELMNLFEIPYKSLQNLKWMYASLQKARSDGCRILLTGQFGNTTISLGDFNFYFNTLFKEGRIGKLIKEINMCQNRYGLSRKMMTKNVIKGAILKLKKRSPKEEEILGVKYINKKLVEQYNVLQRFAKLNMYSSQYSGITLSEVKECIVDKISLSHAGEFETKLSLMTGVLMRDPTKDKRIIEFCLRMPVDQFVRDAIPRRLVREYMKEYLPIEICSQVRYKGVQSADTCKRLERHWNRIYKEVMKVLNTKVADELLDVNKSKEILKKYEVSIPVEYDFDFIKLLYSALLCDYISIYIK